MSNTITIANRKVELARLPPRLTWQRPWPRKRRVLMVDMDPQGNATMASGIDKNELSITVCDVLLGEVGIE